jgi:hypothetical protein
MATRRGAYPGTFNPPTVAHLAVAEAARSQCHLDRVELVLSTTPLGKADDPHLAPLDQRVAALERVAVPHDWLTVGTTDAQLLADIADGYDVLVLGADKWAQVVDASWYASPDERDAAVAGLPLVAVAPRPPHPRPQPTDRIVILDLDPAHHEVSATAVRRGRVQWRAPGIGPEDSR